MKFLLPLLFPLAASALDLAKLPPPAARTVDFAKDIQPLLEAKCAKCHGAEKQKGGYRLDDRQSALTGGDDHAPNIRPGQSAESPLIHFIAGLDPDMKMPAKGDPLSAEEIGLLRAWIDQGAVWPDSANLAKKDPLDWWSLKPLARPAVPAVASTTNPIDAFIRAKLAEKGLAPSAEAGPRTLIRRMTFDLTGLPPSPEEVEAFVEAVNQNRDQAVAALADRLLASPRYGERWARHWLDVVHYADTHGYDKDKPRPNAWPYRDYAIRAFNEDKPYRRFVQEQLAGDALFPGTDDGHDALGFIAAGPWDFIGHAEVDESKTDGKIARLLDRDDMVANTMNTFCAITVQCARCHNHKFDPIKQEDYYRLQADFAALDRADQQFDSDPAIAQRRTGLNSERARLTQQKKDLEKSGAGSGGKLALLDKLIAEFKKARESVERPEFGFHSAISPTQDATKWVQIDLGQPATIAQIVYVGCHDTFNNIGAGFGFPVRYKVELSDDPKFASGVSLIEDRTEADTPNPGVQPQTADAQGTMARYVRITATKLAPRKGDYIFALAEVQALDAAGRNLALGSTITYSDITKAPPRWTGENLVDGYYYGHKAAATPERIAALEKERAERLATAPDGYSQNLAKLEAGLGEIDRELKTLPAPKVVYSGIVYSGTGAFAGRGAQGGQPRPIFVLKRGDVRQPGDEVGPGTAPISRELPAQFDLPAGQPESARRAALAQWITDDRNPLTWRVIVNRVWQYHFGRGLSDSPNDFGRMGRAPTHPELLDWLATEFRDSGGSLKALHRLIVTSATYRQSSGGKPEICDCDEPSGTPPGPDPNIAKAEAIDADNTLLWRMNRRKLEAEAIHDTVLAVAGQLDLTMGGPGYQDFIIQQPAHSPHYEYALHDVEDALAHRRSIYRFIVRSQPQPFMTVLDCADPSMSVEKRNESVNALQALAIRNNRLTVAMGRHFAERVAQLASEPGPQIDAAFRLALGRPPRLEETIAFTDFIKQNGLANACRVIFSLNEFAFVD